MPEQSATSPENTESSKYQLSQSMCDRIQENGACQKLKTKRGHFIQPPDTSIYLVQPNDKLTNIAACFDTTPSVLKKMNRLTMDFLYPAQVLYVPNNTGSHSTASSDGFLSSSSSLEDENTISNSSHTSPSFFTGLKYPGFAHRLPDSIDNPLIQSSYRHQASSYRHQASVSSDEGSSEGKPESSDQCPVQMFVKIRSHYLPREEDEVEGTLLVTPNAVMFHPNVSDPLVMEKGVEEFGMIAKLDTVISAAIYRDSHAMHNLRLQKEDPTICKPEIYHMEGCKLSRNNTLKEDVVDNMNEVNIQDITLSCSCGADDDTLIKSPRSEDKLPSHGGGEHTVDWEDNCWNTRSSSECKPESKTSETNNACGVDNSTLSVNVCQTVNSRPINCKRVVGLEAFDEPGTLDESDYDYNLDDGPVSQSIEKCINSFPKRLGHRRTLSTDSSLYSIGMASTTDIYIDYSSGMFAEHSSCSSNDVDILRKAMLAHHNRTRKPVSALATAQVHAEDAKSVTLHLEPGVNKDERPSLFQPISDLVSDVTGVTDSICRPFYLCLQVGQPINSQCGTDTCPIEAYRKQKKPEYWFIIPGDKVDSLYKFFIQWRPELYGEEITDECTLSSRGFIAIPAGGPKTDVIAELPRSPLVRKPTKVYKDWEVVSVDEIVRRQLLLDVDRHFPDMRGESKLMSEQDIRKLMECLPARVEGHRWRLAYSDEENGFSLKTLYRNMCEFESATIVVVRDDQDGIFGAFSSSPLHLSEHFYGTGECFLFTFVNGFKSYSWSCRNMFCVRGAHHGLTFGTGSATCGLWLDADMYHGRTQHCDTYENEPLTGGNEDFIIKAIEVWGLNDEDYD